MSANSVLWAKSYILGICQCWLGFPSQPSAQSLVNDAKERSKWPACLGGLTTRGPGRRRAVDEMGWYAHVFLQRPHNCKGSHLPPTDSSWEGRLYFQYPGPFLGSLTGVWFMFPNSLPVLLTPHSDEHCTPNKKHSGSMGNSSRPALDWEPQLYLPTPDLSFSIDRRELASIWGECSFN